MKYENGVLKARGLASIEWIIDAPRFARAIPGIIAFDEKDVVSEEVRRIEQCVIRFMLGSSQLMAGQEQELQTLMSDTQKLNESAASIGHNISIEIIGHTDTEGSEAMNERLSADRASRVFSMLGASSVNNNFFAARGAASREPVSVEASEASKQLNRSVSFRVRR